MMAIKPAGKNNVHPYTGIARACGLGPNINSLHATDLYIDFMNNSLAK